MIATKYCGRHIMSMGNYASLCIFLIKFALIWCSARPCTDHTGFLATGCPPARLRYDAAGPCPDAARRTSRPSPERHRVTGGRAQSTQTQKWLSMRRCEYPLHRRRRCAHRGTVCYFAARMPAAYATPYTYYDSLQDVWAWEPLAC